MGDKLLTPREVAERIGRSRDFVMGLVRRRKLRCTKINGRYYIFEWSLEEFLRPPEKPRRVEFPRQVKPRNMRWHEFERLQREHGLDYFRPDGEGHRKH